MLASATASLEQQLDNLERLPVELQKNFAAMRTMDLKTKKMSQKIDSESDAVLAKKLAGPAGSKEIAKIQRMYAKLQKHLDEKVQLAVLTYELVDKHIRHLDADLSRYQSECQENEKQQQAEAKTAAAAAAAAVKPSTSSASAAAATGPAPSTSSRKSSSGSMAAIKKKKRRAVESSEEEKPRRRGGGKVEKGGGGGGGGGKAAPSTAAAAASGSAESKAASSAAAGSRSRERAPATPEPLEPGVIPGLALAAKEAGEVFDMPVDPNEPTYCLCQQVSYGDMIGCDNPDCPIEWFHFPCVGLTSKPKGNWYCPKCSEERKKKK